MKTTLTIPEQMTEQTVHEFRVYPNSKEVVVTVMEDNVYTKVIVDITTLFTNATDAQKNVVRVLFKQIGLAALEKFNIDKGVTPTLTDIQGDIFEDQVTTV